MPSASPCPRQEYKCGPFWVPTLCRSAADGPAAQRQQLQTAHSAAVPDLVPVPEGSGQVQEVNCVCPLALTSAALNETKRLTAFAPAAPARFWTTIRAPGSKRPRSWFIRSVPRPSWTWLVVHVVSGLYYWMCKCPFLVASSCWRRFLLMETSLPPWLRWVQVLEDFYHPRLSKSPRPTCSAALLSFLTAFLFLSLTAHSGHRGELEQLEKRGMSELCEREVNSSRPTCACGSVPACERELQKMTVCLSRFLRNRTVDDKPKRPTRKRQAPEDFLGKGPDRKIFMGKYVKQRGGLNT